MCVTRRVQRSSRLADQFPGEDRDSLTFCVTPPREGQTAVRIGEAVAKFLDRYRDEPGTTQRETRRSRKPGWKPCSPTTGPPCASGRLWRMLYDTAACAEGVLTLDINDLDPEFRLGGIDPVSGRGRLSYPRAEYLFKQASLLHD